MKYSEFLNQNYDMLLRYFDSMRVGVWITDGKGVVTVINKESEQTGGLRREELIGKSMTELIESGYVLYESSVLKAIENRREESIVQALGEGGFLLATSVPLFHGNEVDMVMCIERNISDIVNLEFLLAKQKNLTGQLKDELASFKGSKAGSRDIIACSIEMVKLRERAVNIGAIDATVMITGESGTGKEVVANLIHKSSKRADKPLVKINCAAIPETLLESEFFGYEKGAFTGADKNGKIGLFEQADKGTLFLDEIGDLPLTMQSKLLRAIQEKEVRRIGGEEDIPVDVRLIAATNKNLKEEMEKGNFRQDLYYRLFVVPIEVPPLRDRREDVPQLAYHFVQEFNGQYGLSKRIGEDAIAVMESYSWPGNVRELRNIIERLVVSGAGNEITGFQVQMCLQDKKKVNIGNTAGEGNELSLDEMMYEYEKSVIVKALEKSRNASQAAKLLKINWLRITKRNC